MMNNNEEEVEEEWRIIGKIRDTDDLETFRNRYNQLTVFPVYKEPREKPPPPDTIFAKNSSFIQKSLTTLLEQLVLRAETAEGEAVLQLIEEAIESPGIHVFGELLDVPKIKELENGPHSVHWNTLNLFAYGTYKEYLANKEKYLDLTPAQKKKLQHLTIVTLSAKTTSIPYSILLEELAVENVRDLEKLIIEGFYAAVIQGKLDQENSQLEVDYRGQGRDVTPADIKVVAEKLANWAKSLEPLLTCIEQQIASANTEKQRATDHKEQVQQDAANMRKANLARALVAVCEEEDEKRKKKRPNEEQSRSPELEERSILDYVDPELRDLVENYFDENSGD